MKFDASQRLCWPQDLISRFFPHSHRPTENNLALSLLQSPVDGGESCLEKMDVMDDQRTMDSLAEVVSVSRGELRKKTTTLFHSLDSLPPSPSPLAPSLAHSPPCLIESRPKPMIRDATKAESCSSPMTLTRAVLCRERRGGESYQCAVGIKTVCNRGVCWRNALLIWI